MDWVDILKTFGIAFAVFMPVIAVLRWLAGAIARLAKTELMVHSMWEVMMQDSAGRLLNKGFAKMNSPLVATDQIVEWFSPELIHDLRRFRSANRHLKDMELSAQIMIHFRHRLNKEVNAHCPDVNLQDCIAAAMLIAKIPDDKIDSDEHHDTELEPKSS